MNTQQRYWIISIIGLGLTAFTGLLSVFSLKDWDNYYRLTSELGLNYSEGPLITRVVWTSKWTLMIPTIAIGILLFWGREKSAWFACTISLVGVITVIVIAYLTAYLPIAMPRLWLKY